MADSMIIINGKQSTNPEVRNAVEQLRAEGRRIYVRIIWEAEDYSRYALEALQLNCKTLIAGGGDGTVNAVVCQLLKMSDTQRLKLGILPLGTANDFASSVGIPTDIGAALRLTLNAIATPIDIVCVNQTHYFINMGTAGLGPRITNETPETLKSYLGGLSYFLHALTRLTNLQATKVSIKSERFQWQGEILALGVGNGRQAGGGHQLCPNAIINDGQIDLSIITPQKVLPMLLHSLNRSRENPNIERHRCKSLQVIADKPIIFNLDGEPLSGVQFDFAIKAQAIQCQLPKPSPLLN